MSNHQQPRAVSCSSAGGTGRKCFCQPIAGTGLCPMGITGSRSGGHYADRRNLLSGGSVPRRADEDAVQKGTGLFAEARQELLSTVSHGAAGVPAIPAVHSEHEESLKILRRRGLCKQAKGFVCLLFCELHLCAVTVTSSNIYREQIAFRFLVLVTSFFRREKLIQKGIDLLPVLGGKGFAGGWARFEPWRDHQDSIMQNTSTGQSVLA